METSEAISAVKGKTTPAKRIPYWLWVCIAKSLGIKLHRNDKPIISAILHILTFGSAAGLFFTNTWYSIFNTASVHTNDDILDGTVSVFTIVCFCGLGVYSHRLAYRLFVHPKFLDMLRLHSKTVMKLNTAFVILVILISFVSVLNISMLSYLLPYNGNTTSPTIHPNCVNGTAIQKATINPCQCVELPIVVCQVYWGSQMIFSCFFLAWNLLVAVVLVSVARTQTINIRRFLRELEQDAILLDKQLRDAYGCTDSLTQYVWMDNDNIADVFNEPVERPEAKESAEETPPDDMEDTSTNGDNEPEHTIATAESGASRSPGMAVASRNPTSSFRDIQLRLGPENNLQEINPISRNTSRFRRLSGEEREDDVVTPHVMSEQEIMHKYWKISMSVRLASVALQRWMTSILGLVTAWSAIRMVIWLSHTPSLYGVCMFILPLMLLPLLASSYAEVNYEGVKVIQSILPTEKRVPLFQYLYGHPIQMTTYGHALSYGTIGTVVAAILAAFASKILLQEVNTIQA